uniref:Uncharacterized protein n=1 Tax=Oncorhynchus kisutch TaxID=8019 RepID=A0A8C7CSB0_ONCKI
MAVLGLEILGVILAVLGWILSIVSCAMPMWRVSAFIGVNIITAQTMWEGIWMTCMTPLRLHASPQLQPAGSPSPHNHLYSCGHHGGAGGRGGG